MNINWDVKGYTNNYGFVTNFGENALEWIDAKAGSFVVDLGCGNGILTQKLRDMGYDVLGLDASEPMLERARKDFPELEFKLADATDFTLDRKADCIFTNSVIHWIDKDLWPKLLSNISDNLAPGGSFVCEFGGYGCAETVHSSLEKAFANHGLVYPRTFNFSTVGEFTPLIEQAGMLVEGATLFERPSLQKEGTTIVDWINMFIQTPFIEVDTDTRQQIIDETVELTKPLLLTERGWMVDYVRLRVKARKL